MRALDPHPCSLAAAAYAVADRQRISKIVSHGWCVGCTPIYIPEEGTLCRPDTIQASAGMAASRLVSSALLSCCYFLHVSSAVWMRLAGTAFVPRRDCEVRQ